MWVAFEVIGIGIIIIIYIVVLVSIALELREVLRNKKGDD